MWTTNLYLSKANINIEVPTSKASFMMFNQKSSTLAVNSASISCYYQVPANADVKPVPISLLPLDIRQKMLAAISCSDVPENGSVIYVSPVNTITTKDMKHLGTIYPMLGSLTPQLSDCTRSQRAPMCRPEDNNDICYVSIYFAKDPALKILQIILGTPRDQLDLEDMFQPTENTKSSGLRIIHIKGNFLVIRQNKMYLLVTPGSTNSIAKTKGSTSHQSPKVSSNQTEFLKDILKKQDEDLASKMNDTLQCTTMGEPVPLNLNKTLPEPSHVPLVQQLNIKKESYTNSTNHNNISEIPLGETQAKLKSSVDLDAFKKIQKAVQITSPKQVPSKTQFNQNKRKLIDTAELPKKTKQQDSCNANGFICRPVTLSSALTEKSHSSTVGLPVSSCPSKILHNTLNYTSTIPMILKSSHNIPRVNTPRSCASEKTHCAETSDANETSSSYSPIKSPSSSDNPLKLPTSSTAAVKNESGPDLLEIDEITREERIQRLKFLLSECLQRVDVLQHDKNP